MISVLDILFLQIAENMINTPDISLWPSYCNVIMINVQMFTYK